MNDIFDDIVSELGFGYSNMIGRKYIIYVRSDLRTKSGEVVRFDTELPLVFNSYRAAKKYIKCHKEIDAMKIRHFKIKPYKRKQKEAHV